MLSRERLKELLTYCPETGIFRWAVSRSNVRAGSVAGGLCREGYWEIRADRELHLAHRLAWLYMTGAYPEETVDHINCDRCDNRFTNLRAATYTENSRNRPKRADNKSGHIGVYWHKKNRKWIAYICIDKKTKYLGSFEKKAEAVRSYELIAEQAFGQFVHQAA